MQKNLVAPLAVFALLVSLTSCDPFGIKGKGDIVTETREPGAFSRINVELPANVTVVHGDEYSVYIEVEESLIDYLETSVNNGRLTVRFTENTKDVDGLYVRITMPIDPSEIRLDGSGYLTVADSISNASLRLELDGSGTIEAEKINNAAVVAELDGSGRISLGGAAADADYRLKGSGSINAFSLLSNDVRVILDGSGTVECSASHTFKVSLNGSGNVWYDGDPLLDLTISGSGKVRKI